MDRFRFNWRVVKIQIHMSKNPYITVYLSFVAGFGLIFLGQLVLAVNGPSTPPLEGSIVAPVVHSIDIAGGAADTDGDGVSINNDGKVEIEANDLGGTHLIPRYGLTVLSNKGALRSTAPYNPIAGINSMKVNKGGPDEYGRVGVEGWVAGNQLGNPNITKGFVGHVKSLVNLGASDLEPLDDLIPDALIPYSFYTTGDTRIGTPMVVDGSIKNNSGDVIIAGDTEVRGNIEVQNNVETDVLNFSNVNNLDDRFFETQEEASSPSVFLAEESFNYNNGEIFSRDATCPSDSYLVGCSGTIFKRGDGSDYLAPYRGARMTSSNAKGGVCTAYARKPSLAIPPGRPGSYYDFALMSYAYCFRPH